MPLDGMSIKEFVVVLKKIDYSPAVESRKDK